MQTLRIIKGRYLMVLLAMCGLVASSIGILTNTDGMCRNCGYRMTDRRNAQQYRQRSS